MEGAETGTDTEEDSSGKPIPLLQFSPDNGNSGITITENLVQVLNQVRTMPICTITICGPANLKKRIMLAYLIRHLETLESDKDQTGVVNSEKEKMLKGSNLSNSLIDGIWIWNKPFILKDEDGDQIAVVLLVTDVAINDETFSKIFGLCLLTSTIMIMNLETLEEEILSELIPYVELATLAKNDLEDGDTFFHRLSFLISDWNDTEKFPHGSKGGRKFLERKLELHESDSLELVQVRKCLEKYFKELDCFLMPRVGENGECQRITLTDAETYHNFAKRLEEYLKLVVNRENLIKMELLGEIFNRNEFQRLFETFANIFNSDCSPQAETLWKATCQIVNENILEKAIKKYLSLMEARLKSMAYAQKDDLEQAHFRSFSQVKDFFKKAKKFGVSEPFPDLRKQLEIKIDSEYKQVKANNEENKTAFVSQAISEAKTEFQNELERQLPLSEADLNFFYDDAHFKKVAITLKACVIGAFKDKLEKEDQEEIPSLINKVQGLLDSAFATHLDKNNLHRKNAEEMMKSVISSLLEKWRISFASFLDQNKIEENVSKFQAFHNTLKISALHELTSTKKAENAELQQKSQALLFQNMDQQFSSLVKTHLHNISKMKAKQLALIDHVIKEHDGKLQQTVAKYEEMDAHQLRMEIAKLFHIHESFVYLTNFQNTSPFPQETQAYSQLETKLQNSLDLPLNRVIHRLNSYKQKCRESWKLAGDKSFGFYREKLGAFVDSEKCLKDKDLQEEHKQLANWAFVKFVNEEKTGEVDDEKEILSELQNKMQNYLETAQNELEKSRANAKENAKVAANEYATAYKEELTSRVEQAKSKKELWKFHSNSMANGVTYLEQRIPKKFPNILQKFQHILFQNMTEALQKYKSHFNPEIPIEIKCKSHFAPAIGIDLGTTECCVGVYLNGKVIIIPNMEQGFALTTPSYVGFSLSGEVTIGKVAKSSKFLNSTQIIYDLKRIIGKNMGDCDLQQDIKFWPFTLKEYDGVLKVVVSRQPLYPEQVCAQLLSYFRLMAEKFLKLEIGSVTKAVITVPACFNDGQRQATIDAGKLAGLEVTLLNEPTAAGIAYSMERMDTASKKILVYDLGEGTFDVALIEVNGRDVNVLGVNGDAHLGGDDFDNNMINYCVDEFKKKHRIDLMRGRDSVNMIEREETRFRLGRLKTQCELVRDYLSHFTKATVTVLSIMDRIDLKVEVCRDTFAALNYHLIAKTVKLMEELLKENCLNKEDVDDILLLGGSSRIPIVGEMLQKYFEGRELNKSIHPGHTLASGAALLAARMNGMQAVGKVDFGSIQDVTTIPIYIEIEGDLSLIFEKNLKIPVSRRRIIKAFDNQTEICVKILQGDRSVIAARDKLLGEFLISGIPIGEAEEEVEISIEIDAMGILHVIAKQGLNS